MEPSNLTNYASLANHQGGQIATQAGGGDLSYWQFVILVIVCGALGGFIAATLKALIHHTDALPEENNHASRAAYLELGQKFRSGWTFAARSVVGIGGAFAAILGGSWIGKINYTGNTENIVNLSALCVVAGTVADSLMPGIGRRLQDEFFQKRVKNLEKNSKQNAVEIHEQIEQTVKKVEEAQTYNVSISHADTALSTKTPIDVDRAIDELEALRMTHPSDRTTHVYLGRLYRIKKDYDTAINILRKFISNLSTLPNAPAHLNEDTAVAYYNIACYHALKHIHYTEEKTHQSTEVPRLKHETKEALALATKLDSKYLKMALNDSDFNGTLSQEEIQQCT